MNREQQSEVTEDSFYFAYSFINIGRLVIAQKNNSITAVSFLPVSKKYIKNETDLILSTKKQLEEYFAGKRKKFYIPLATEGTEFQKKVWSVLLEIPYGTVRSYRDIAHRLGNSKAARAVGSACNKNPVCIIIPCHRVIGSNGYLTGYAHGLVMKQKLLELENAI